MELDAHQRALVAGLSKKQRLLALSRYENKKKSVVVEYLLWFFFGVYYFYLGKPWRNLFLWMTFPFLVGVIWWLVDLFRVWGMVEEQNNDLFLECIKDAKAVFD